jgi:hypothetical protein
MPLCPPQTQHAARTRTRPAAVGSQQLTAWAMTRPSVALLVNKYHAYNGTPKVHKKISRIIKIRSSTLQDIRYKWIYIVLDSGSRTLISLMRRSC